MNGDEYRELVALMRGDDVPDVENIRALLAPRPAWMADALCREPDHAAVNFFPTRGEATEPAKAVCARCPVADECLAFALDSARTSGIWGGTTERQRRRSRLGAA